MLMFRFIFVLCLYRDMFPCFNVQKALYFSHTACILANIEKSGAFQNHREGGVLVDCRSC